MKDGIHGSCAAQGWNRPNQIKKQTNADRIRSMSDEELAEFLTDSGCCIASEKGVDCSQVDECGICGVVIRDWLQSEVEVDKLD